MTITGLRRLSHLGKRDVSTWPVIAARLAAGAWCVRCGGMVHMPDRFAAGGFCHVCRPEVDELEQMAGRPLVAWPVTDKAEIQRLWYLYAVAARA